MIKAKAINLSLTSTAITNLNGDGYSDGVLSTLGTDSLGRIKTAYGFNQGTCCGCPPCACRCGPHESCLANNDVLDSKYFYGHHSGCEFLFLANAALAALACSCDRKHSGDLRCLMACHLWSEHSDKALCNIIQ